MSKGRGVTSPDAPGWSGGGPVAKVPWEEDAASEKLDLENCGVRARFKFSEFEILGHWR